MSRHKHVFMTFSELNLIAPILNALTEEGYTQPTPIQEQAIPTLLEGRDLLGCAQTGTGKTAAFSIPILQLLYNKKNETSTGRGNWQWNNSIKALILTPTRELAIQIDESIGAYGRNTGMRHAVIFGGVGQKPQTDTLRRGVDILIATPGRLLDLMSQGFVNLKSIEFFVLDEADRMLDMGFVHDVKKVIAQLPPRRQSLFFSATMPPEIVKLAGTILTNPASVEVTPASTTAETVEQKIYLVEANDKRDLLVQLLSAKSVKTALVFARTKHGADKIAKFLNQAGIKADAIHGNKAQNARQRALASFKDQTITALVATDIAARGIDVSSLELVINYELPNVPETYVHRIGRTGRAGASGLAVSFCDTEEREYLRDIQKLIGKSLPIETDNPFASNNLSAVDKPQSKSAGGQKSASSGRPNNGRGGGSGGGRPQQNNGRSGQNNGRSGGGDAQRDEFVRPPQSHQAQPRQESAPVASRPEGPREGTQPRSPRPQSPRPEGGQTAGPRPADPRTGGPRGGGGPRPAAPARSNGRQNRSGGSGSGYGGGSSDPFSY
jgi:ATP-dependent RNA helicase RhlE